MLKRIIFSIFLLANLLTLQNTQAQELRCKVIVNDERVRTQERQIIDEMAKALTAFMNNTRWTDDRYEEWERIDCNILIVLDKDTNIEQSRYSGNAQIQYNRVVYNSSYTSPILNYFDQDFDFTFTPSEPLIYIENATNNNLTLMLAYYAYVILALDYDTFAPLGGNPFVEQAQNILNNVQSVGVSNVGWLDNDIRARYWLAQNLINPQFLEVRKSLYNYHRLGLDRILEAPEAPVNQALDALKKWQALSEIRLNALLIQSLFDAKGEELYQLFSRAEAGKKREAAQILIALDPAHADLYRKLRD